MKRFAIVICFCLCLLTSCLGSSVVNDNARLYNTEWSNGEENEGLKFFSDNSVLFYSELGTRAIGSFDYDASSKVITFNGLTVMFTHLSGEITSADLLQDGAMKMYWHELGKSTDYFEILYQRR